MTYRLPKSRKSNFATEPLVGLGSGLRDGLLSGLGGGLFVGLFYGLLGALSVGIKSPLVVAACEQSSMGLQTRTIVGQGSVRIRPPVSQPSVQMDQHSYANGLQIRPRASAYCEWGKHCPINPPHASLSRGKLVEHLHIGPAGACARGSIMLRFR
jgi:predicted lipid-binding transport protein (Tim44 family)